MISTGQTITVGDDEYVVVWNGEEGLIPPRSTKVGMDWVPPTRQYNRTGKHKKQPTKQLDIQSLGD